MDSPVDMIDVYTNIRSTSHSQQDILLSIIKLHNGGNSFEIDATYSKGEFYKSGKVDEPFYKYDINPAYDHVIKCDARNLPFNDKSVSSIILDPPFLDGASPGAKLKGKMTQRFTSVPKIADLWTLYNEMISEAYRILKQGGILVFKCQDVVSQRANFFSHCYVLNSANSHGFYAKDLFILLNDNRMTGKWKKQSHARKHHSYFWVFSKQKIKVVNHRLNLK